MFSGNISDLINYLVDNYPWLLILITFLVYPIGPFVIIPNIIKRTHKKVINKIAFSYKKTNTYNRQIPFEGDLNIIYFIAKQSGILKNFTFIPAFITQMIYDNKVELIADGQSFILDFTNYSFYKENNSNIDKLYQIIKPGLKNNLISGDELSRLFEKGYKDLQLLDQYICSSAMKKLYFQNLIIFKHRNYKLTSKLKDMMNDLNNHINYLKDFTILNERKIIEVKLWHDYLIIATLLGIKDMVDDDLKLLYIGVKIESFYENIFKTFHPFSSD